MTIITDYAFGRMTIDGKTYTSDLIILPGGRILHDWYRESGHLLIQADIKAVLEESPDLIIVGTGAYGRMDIASGLEAALEKKGIRLLSLETAKAADRYSTESKNNTKGLCGCFHLTC